MNRRHFLATLAATAALTLGRFYAPGLAPVKVVRPKTVEVVSNAIAKAWTPHSVRPGDAVTADDRGFVIRANESTRPPLGIVVDSTEDGSGFCATISIAQGQMLRI